MNLSTLTHCHLRVRLALTLALAAISPSLLPASSASAADTTLNQGAFVTHGGSKFWVVGRATIDAYRCGRLGWLFSDHCMDVSDVRGGVTWWNTGTRPTRVESKVSVLLDGKKFTYGTKGFSLVSNNTVCEAPWTSGTTSTMQQGDGKVCGLRVGPRVNAPSEVRVKIDYQVRVSGTSYFGNRTFSTRSFSY